MQIMSLATQSHFTVINSLEALAARSGEILKDAKYGVSVLRKEHRHGGIAAWDTPRDRGRGLLRDRKVVLKTRM